MKEGWKVVKFDECVNKSPKQRQIKSKDYKTSGKYPIVSQEKKIISGYCDDESYLYKHVRPVIIFGDHTKEIKFIDFDFVIGADGTQIILPKDNIDVRFFYYYLLAKPIRTLGYARHYKILREQIFNIPPLPEQHRIVKKLDAAFEKIDAMKAKAEKNIENAKALFQQTLAEELEPKEGWVEKKLGEVGTLQRGGNFLKRDFIENGFPCIHYGQIHTKFDVTTYKHLTCIPHNMVREDKLASKGDLIIAITSEDVEASCKCTAWMGNYDVAIGAHTAIFKHQLNPIYVSYYFKTRKFFKEKEKYAHGFKVVEIKPIDIAKIPIVYPPLPEQQQIVTKLDILSAKCKKFEEAERKTIAECDALKQAILRQVFNGEL